MKIGWRKLLAVVMALAALAAICVPHTGAADQRLSARIDEPFEVNGALYPAGELSVRLLGAYTPSSSLYEIRIGGESLGMLLATEVPAGSEERGDALFFDRDPHGHLVLTGFAYRGQRARDLSQLHAGGGENSMLLVAR